MKLLNQFLCAAAALVATGSMASAQVAEAPVANRAIGWCSIEAQLEVTSFHAIIGFTQGRGHGHINCEYADGAKEIIPIFVTTKMGGVGAGFSIKHAGLFASGVGVETFGGAGLAGHYAMAKASAEVVAVGADAGLSFTANGNGFSIPLTLQGNVGFGLEGSVDAGEMDIQIVQ